MINEHLVMFLKWERVTMKTKNASRTASNWVASVQAVD